MGKSMFLKLFLTLFLIIFTQNTLAADVSKPPKINKFFTISDVHFDPFASCRLMTITPCVLILKLHQAPWQDWESIFEKSDFTPPATGSDSNYALLKSSIDALKNSVAEEHPRFGFFLGDFLAHNYHVQYALYSHDVTKQGYQDFVTKTYEFLIHEYTQALPATDIYPVLGNNDAYEDYQVVVNGKLLRQQGEIWAGLIHNKINHAIFASEFPKAGYYSVLLPNTDNQRIIALDSVLFSRHINSNAAKFAALTELGWLHGELVAAAAKHENVIIAYHIPIGVDVYATLKNYLKTVEEFWQPSDNVAFEALVKNFSGTIKIILAGHIHMDNFEIMNRENLPVALSFTPSISPIYGNNPSFKIYSYDSDTLGVKNYTTYYSPLADAARDVNPAWKKEYNFNQVYESSCNDCDVIKGMTLMTPRGESASFFKLYYGVSSRLKSIEQTFMPYYWCGTQALSDSEWLACTPN
jgi:sphingomyelin phosphodiesterase acid-like 3